jgi:hypothetical protein
MLAALKTLLWPLIQEFMKLLFSELIYKKKTSIKEETTYANTSQKSGASAVDLLDNVDDRRLHDGGTQ